MSYTIKDIAKIMNVNPSTIRYYDSIGLLPDVKKVNGRRVFENKDFKWLRVLNCMKRINMPINIIREYVELAELRDSTLSQRYELILEQQNALKNELMHLNECYKELEYKKWYYEHALKQGTEEGLDKFAKECPTLEAYVIPKCLD